MEIKYNFGETYTTATLYGELDEYSAEYVRMSIDNMLETGKIVGGTLVLDFSHVSFMDSTGVGVLLGRYKKFIKNSAKITIKNPSAHVDRILKMSGIYGLMPLV